MGHLASACFTVAGVVFFVFLWGNVMDVREYALGDLPAITPAEVAVHVRNCMTIKGVSDFLGSHLVVRVIVYGLHDICKDFREALVPPTRDFVAVWTGGLCFRRSFFLSVFFFFFSMPFLGIVPLIQTRRKNNDIKPVFD